MSAKDKDLKTTTTSWLIEPAENEEAFIDELMELRPPCARSSLLTHKRGLADKEKKQQNNDNND